MRLPKKYRNFIDLPGQHTLTLLDWQHEASLDLFTQAQADLGLYPDTSLGEVLAVLTMEGLGLSRTFLES